MAQITDHREVDFEFCDADFLRMAQQTSEQVAPPDIQAIYDLARQHVLARLFVGVRADRMMRPVTPLRPDMSLAEAAKSLLAQEIKGAPVVDDQGLVIGFLSEADYLRHLKVNRVLGLLLDDDASRQGAMNAAGGVRAAMAFPVVMVRADARVTDITAAFHTHTWRWLPVVDGEDRLLGMIQRRDFLAVTLNGEAP